MIEGHGEDPDVVHGFSRALNGFSRALNGFSRALNGFSRAGFGRPEGPGQELLRATQITSGRARRPSKRR
jgi:hypothetical protein